MKKMKKKIMSEKSAKNKIKSNSVSAKLEIKDLHVEIGGQEILKGINLEVPKGKIVALMGPNGSGKSTLANTIMGHPSYKITKGKIFLDGEDITSLSPDIRAKKGLFLSFQYPAEISGVTISNFLRAALNSRRTEKISVLDFHKLIRQKMEELKIDSSFGKRYLNLGFSGGEKKRAEILQMSILEPTYALLDETDSGLDVDALKIVCKGINKLKNKDRGMLIITHYFKMLDYIVPDIVYVMHKGKIIKSGNKKLALEIEKNGYKNICGVDEK